MAGDSSISGPAEWVMEEANPQRNRQGTGYPKLPLVKSQTFQIQASTRHVSPISVNRRQLLLEGDQAWQPDLDL